MTGDHCSPAVTIAGKKGTYIIGFYHLTTLDAFGRAKHNLRGLALKKLREKNGFILHRSRKNQLNPVPVAVVATIDG